MSAFFLPCPHQHKHMTEEGQGSGREKVWKQSTGRWTTHDFNRYRNLLFEKFIQTLSAMAEGNTNA